MKDVFVKSAAVLAVFVAGCLFGSTLLYLNLRLSAIEQQQIAFQKNVEQFAKQVNDEFAKFRVKPEGQAK